MAEELLPNDDVTKISSVSGVKEIIWRDDWHVDQLCTVGDCLVFPTCTKYVDIFKNIIFVRSGATFPFKPSTDHDWSVHTVLINTHSALLWPVLKKQM